MGVVAVEPATADAALAGSPRFRGIPVRGGSAAQRAATVARLLAAGAVPCIISDVRADTDADTAAGAAAAPAAPAPGPGVIVDAGVAAAHAATATGAAAALLPADAARWANWTALHRAASRGMVATCHALLDAIPDAQPEVPAPAPLARGAALAIIAAHGARARYASARTQMHGTALDLLPPVAGAGALEARLAGLGCRRMHHAGHHEPGTGEGGKAADTPQ
jgi:hypothetical protein